MMFVCALHCFEGEWIAEENGQEWTSEMLKLETLSDFYCGGAGLAWFLKSIFTCIGHLPLFSAGLLSWIDVFEFLSATKGRPIPRLRLLTFVHMVFWVSPKPQTHGRFQEVVIKLFGRSLAWVFACPSMAENRRLVTSTSEGPKEIAKMPGMNLWCFNQNLQQVTSCVQPAQQGGSAARPHCNSSVQWGARCANLRHLTETMSGKTAQNNGGLISSLA